MEGSTARAILAAAVHQGLGEHFVNTTIILGAAASMMATTMPVTVFAKRAMEDRTAKLLLEKIVHVITMETV